MVTFCLDVRHCSLFEEVTYRLVFCPPFAALVGVRSCIALNGLLFAALHILYGNPSPENLVGASSSVGHISKARR